MTPALQALQNSTTPDLTVLEIFSLIGYATGAALHLYLCWMLYSRYGLRRTEHSLLGLGLSLSFFHLGNFAAEIYKLIYGSIDTGRGSWWLNSAYSVAYVAVSFLPATLAHAHFRVWSWVDERAPRRFFRPLIIASYVPLILLPWVVYQLWSTSYQDPTERLSAFLMPFIFWIVVVFIECAMIDWIIASRSRGARERKFFQVFGAALAIIGALYIVTFVLGFGDWGTLGKYLVLIAYLSSIAPTTIVAYYIYRYRTFELVIRRSFVYAILASTIMVVYIYGIRRLSVALYERYNLRAEAVEALLILVVILLAGPLRRLTDGYLQRLFAREVGLYRGLVAQVGSAASHYGELAHFVEFAERRLREALELREICIVPGAGLQGETAEVCRLAEERQLTEIEDRSLLARLGALASYSLWREGRVVGLMIVRDTAQSLTAEKREVLSVLAGHIAVAIENCQLLEEKVKLERELAERERLASLGQMAMTVAHEIKNPLSAIKSITQVMREDEQVSSEYARDLDLITSEVDRLNRSVTQLLSFSRPSVIAASSAALGEIVENVLAILRSEAEDRQVQLVSRLATDPVLNGETSAAIKEILLNLALNAVQSVKSGGAVTIESEKTEGGQLSLAVTDDGLGIPLPLRDKIFEPFFTTKQRGTGLGLAIVARRVRELDGSIRLRSPLENGPGARFELVLPLHAKT
ncbi:MAG: ATP-binding protein [Acidobacteria bacterium]|nr:ATP-binding protein [Acidobacteriota bacterium]